MNSKSFGRVRHYAVPDTTHHVILEEDLFLFFDFLEALYEKTDKSVPFSGFLSNSMDDLLRNDKWAKETILKYEDIEVTLVEINTEGMFNER